MGFVYIYLNNPPVNALSSSTRQTLLSQVKAAENDDEVNGIVVRGLGQMFCGGADIREFGSTNAFQQPLIHDLVEMLQNCEKPTIAYIHGFALGGGLEIALGCQYRVAFKSAKLGLPEINLGLIPAGGGTQLLPRLVGLDNAMKIMTSGKNISANDALSLGLLDFVAESHMDLQNKCQEICLQHSPQTKIWNLPVPDAEDAVEIYNKHKKITEKKYRGAIAANECLRLAGLSCEISYEDGKKAETECFLKLVSGAQAQALQYVFFTERMLPKWVTKDKISAESPSKSINSVAVVGLGTMGSTIAIAFLQIGLPVLVMDSNKESTTKAVQSMYFIIRGMQSSGVITESFADKMIENITVCASYKKFKNVDLVVEAVFESMELKKEVMVNCDKYCKDDCILATNTSTLDIDEIASVTERPDKVIGMHFFAPAHRMKLLENVRGKLTSPHTIATCMNVGFQLKKATILVGNCTGFVVNRMYANFLLESEFILEEGAYPHEVDAVLKKFGFPMGRFEVTDVAGNDVGYRVRKSQGLLRSQQAPGTDDRMRKGCRYCPLTEILVEAGRNGYKTDFKGWFKYEAMFSPPIVDEEVHSLIDDYRKQHGIEPRRISEQEILDRMLCCMVNEGFKILEDKMAMCPEHIDIAWINGMGWPKHTGGPMFYAYTLGLPRILEIIESRWEQSKYREMHWKPANMLVNLVKLGNPDMKDWQVLSQEQDIMEKAESYVKFSHDSLKDWISRMPEDLYKFDNVEPARISKVAIVGVSRQSSSIAVACFKLGVPILLIDTSKRKLNEAIASIISLVPQSDRRDEALVKQYVSKAVHPTDDFSKLEGCDLVIESAKDNIQVKKEIFSYIDICCKPDTCVITCTKLMSIDQLACLLSRPQQVIGMQFGELAHENNLVEIVQGCMSSSRTILSAISLADKLEKYCVLVKDEDGFLMNRMTSVILSEGEYLLEEGCYPKQVDEVLKDFGFEFGIFEMQDKFGIEASYKVQKSLNTNPNLVNFTKSQRRKSRSKKRSSRLTERLVKKGRNGLETSFKGWYNFTEEDFQPDPEVRSFIDEYRLKNGFTSRDIEEREVFDRLIFSVINEGFKILEEKVAHSPQDIDVAWINCMGWPKRFGGPMYYAFNYGLGETLSKIESRYREVGENESNWKPSKLLNKLVNVYKSPPINQWTQIINNICDE